MTAVIDQGMSSVPVGRLQPDDERDLRPVTDDIDAIERAIVAAHAAGDTQLAIANELRLAVAHHDAGHRTAAAEWFTDLLTRRRELEDAGVLDLALHHDGERLAGLGLFDLARARFDEALQLRRRRGTRIQVRSTLAAIQALPL